MQMNPRVLGYAENTIAVMPVAVILFNNRYRIIYVNPEAEKLYGFSNKELTGMRFRNFLKVLGADKYDKLDMKSLFSDHCSTSLLPLTIKDGKEGVYEILTFRLVDYKNGIQGVISIHENVTRERLMSKFLHESEERYKAIFNNSLDMIYIFDLKANFLDANDAALKATGYNKSEIKDINAIDLLKHIPEQISRFGGNLKKVLEGHIAYEPSVYNLMKKDGSFIEIEATSSIMNRYGEPYAIMGIGRNITETGRACRAMRRLNEVLLGLSDDYSAEVAKKNIDILVTACGEITSASCVMYNHVKDDNVITESIWNEPDDYKRVDKAEGHICTDVINDNTGNLCIINDLQNSHYAETDPNIKKYDLETYVGRVVRHKGKGIGSLCAVYTEKDKKPEEVCVEILSMVACAIKVEESRRLNGG